MAWCLNNWARYCIYVLPVVCWSSEIIYIRTECNNIKTEFHSVMFVKHVTNRFSVRSSDRCVTGEILSFPKLSPESSLDISKMLEAQLY
jgi:hypothetical protein